MVDFLLVVLISFILTIPLAHIITYVRVKCSDDDFIKTLYDMGLYELNYSKVFVVSLIGPFIWGMIQWLS